MRRALAMVLVACVLVPMVPNGSAVPPDDLFLFFERTLDVSQYTNGSMVEAWAALRFPGVPDPPGQVDNIEFRWYAPNGTLVDTAAIDPDGNGWALHSLRVVVVGPWAVNATYVGTPALSTNRTFDVLPETWGGTVVLARSTMVGATANLTIAAGTTIRSDPGVYIRVKGTLTAAGSPSQTILFTANATAPGPGSWTGLLFHSEAADRSTLTSVRVQYPEDGVRVEGASPQIRDVLVADASRNGFQLRNTTMGLVETGASRSLNGFWLEGAAITLENVTLLDLSYGVVAFGGAVDIRNATVTNTAQFGITASAAPMNLTNVAFDGGGVGIATEGELRGERLSFLDLTDAVAADGSSARVVLGNSTFGATALRHLLVTNGARVSVISGGFPASGERLSISGGSDLSLWNYLGVHVRDRDAGDANLTGATVRVYANEALTFTGTTDRNGTIPVLLMPYRRYAPVLEESLLRIRVDLAGYAFANNDRNLTLVASGAEIFLGSTSDLDGDGDPDFSDLDVDGDELDNDGEAALGTDPRDPDTDGDGLPDGWEFFHGLDAKVPDAGEDGDGDGLTNLEEYAAGTDPRAVDTDEDRLPDGWEVAHGLDPTNGSDADEDPDGDAYSNLLEYRGGTDPRDPNSVPREAWPGTLWFAVALVTSIAIIALSLVLGRRRRGPKASSVEPLPHEDEESSLHPDEGEPLERKARDVGHPRRARELRRRGHVAADREDLP